MVDKPPIQPIFIVGVGRSGTSLLHSILASHPDVFFPPETSILRRLVFAGRIPNRIDNNSLKSVWKALSSDRRFSRLEIATLDELRRILQLGNEAITGTEFYIRILSALAQEKKMFGDKDPKLVEILPIIHLAWPQAYVFHVIRDPRDVVASKKRAKWSKGKPLWYHLLANRVQYHAGRKDGIRLFGSRYIEVFYEELLQDDDAVMRRLCEVLRIEFVPSMLSFSIEAKRLVTDEEVAWKKETLGPLLKENMGKWQTTLSSVEIAVTEMVCAAALSDNAFCLPSTNGHWRFSAVRMLAKVYGSLIILVSWAYMPLRWLRLRRFSLVA